MKKLNGFSLIELMVVVSILGILAMMAVPSYQQYTHRARFVEVIASTEIYKTAIALALQSGTPANTLTTGIYGIPSEPIPTKNLASIKVSHGIITSIATELVDNATYILKPNHDGSHWSISGTCVKNGLCNS